MAVADLYEGMDPRADPVREEAKALLVRVRGCLAYAEEACRLEEEWRDVEERRLAAWRKCEAAMAAQVSTQNRIGLRIIGFVALASVVVANVVYLARWLL
jgi:uncharacterized membrane protein